jgi:23S rRNA pseudouridine1911/1915/1917 synthase
MANLNEPLDESLDILYEDNHVIAIKKPAGLLTQETPEEYYSLENLCKAWLKAKYGKPGNVFVGVIHRLDRPVSGIVLFAKTSKALCRLNESIRLRQMQKTYIALIQGQLKLKSGTHTLEHYLRHDDFRASICNKSDASSKLARLHYSCLETFKHSSLVEIHLETGRYHQIRAQFAAIGHPVVGDIKYGSAINMSDDSIALHHAKLQFFHPITKAPIILISEPEKWEKYR